MESTTSIDPQTPKSIANPEMIQTLNSLLADQWVLLVKSLNYHWNVEGMQFGEMHKLLETLYKEVFEQIDLVAERVRALGGRPLGTLGDITESARLSEASGANRAPHEMLQDLLKDLEAFNRSLRVAAGRSEDEFKDYGSTDLLTGLLRENEKQAWMLRASIQQ
ncbi:MAG: DNA starvation/stationary phase protection protein [Bdellovibrionia bacterium]